jgi:hypothetical protein
MKRTDSSNWLIAAVVLASCQAAMAVPTFQVYIKDGTPGIIGEDQDTWFGGGSPLDLIVVGAYNLGGSKETVKLTQVTLVLSVPETEMGAISITGGDVGATLLAAKHAVVRHKSN